MAKANDNATEGQGLTKKQLKRLQRKQKKLLAEAGQALGASSHQNVAALADRSAADRGRSGGQGDKTAVPGVNVLDTQSTDYRSVKSNGALGGKEKNGFEVLPGDDDYIRNSLVGKVAEALLRKQLEEEVQAGPVKKKARLAKRASEAEPSAVSRPVGQDNLPARTKVEKMKLRKKKKKQKKERQKQRRGHSEALEVPSPGSRHQGTLKGDREEGQGGGVVSGKNLKKRRRAETDPRNKKKERGQNGQEGPSEPAQNNNQQGGSPSGGSSKKRQRGKDETQESRKQAKNERSSPWPEIKYEASSAEVFLRSGQSLMIDGAANLTLLSGGASVMGYRLRKDEEVLVSSSGQLAPVPIIVHVEEAGRAKDETVPEEVTGVAREGGEEQMETMLLLRSYWPRKGDAVANQRTFRLEAKTPAGSSKPFPKPPPNPAAPSPSKTKPTETKLHPIIIPLSWKTVTDSVLGSGDSRTREATVTGQDQATCAGVDEEAGRRLAKPPIVAVCGGKNVGKSTYGQYLVNRLLNSYPTVAYLETDVGQPEFTAPGLLSLHLLTAPVTGPPSTHLRGPTTSYFYGDVSAKTDPELYLRCVVALYDGFRRKYYDTASDGMRIPLVINTHGWVKGLGLDVLIDILRYTVPTHVVDVQSAKANKNLPPGNFWDTTAEPLSHVHYIPTAVPDTPDASAPFAHKFAPEERALRLLAHFQTATVSGDPPGLGFSEKDAYSSLATCLVHHRPFQVSLDSVRILQLHAKIPPEEALWALNGAVVGLAKETGAAETGPLPRCLGVGLVRGIDAAKGVLFLITGLPLSELQNVNTLVQGKVDLPLPLLSAPPYVSPYLAFNSIAAEGTGSAMVKSRNNIVRKVGD